LVIIELFWRAGGAAAVGGNKEENVEGMGVMCPYLSVYSDTRAGLEGKGERGPLAAKEERSAPTPLCADHDNKSPCFLWTKEIKSDIG
jgi:hypothetical protein